MADSSGAAVSRRATIAAIAFAVALVLIWGNLHSVGGSSPAQPQVLVTTDTFLVLFTEPYLVRDTAGWHVQWAGVALGVLLTAICAAAGWWFCRRPPGDATGV